MGNNKAATGNVASDEKIQRAGRDLQHCSFHLSFILIVITGCDVKPYILIGTSDGDERAAATRLCSTRAQIMPGLGWSAALPPPSKGMLRAGIVFKRT